MCVSVYKTAIQMLIFFFTIFDLGKGHLEVKGQSCECDAPGILTNL